MRQMMRKQDAKGRVSPSAVRNDGQPKISWRRHTPSPAETAIRDVKESVAKQSEAVKKALLKVTPSA